MPTKNAQSISRGTLSTDANQREQCLKIIRFFSRRSRPLPIQIGGIKGKILKT